MIFSELYSAYYNAVSRLIERAVGGELDINEMRRIITETAFSESLFQLEPSITRERWKLIKSDFSTPLKHVPSMPLTFLQKRWLKAVMLDKRVRLFNVKLDGLEDVEPLFTEEDYYVFDKYSDGDNYEDEEYINNFRTIIDAIKNHYPLKIYIISRKGRYIHMNVYPHHLEYSAKDDKFRLITSSGTYSGAVNLSRIIACQRYEGGNVKRGDSKIKRDKEITLEITDGRNALERVMLHFAHFEKQAERLDDNKYRLTVKYNVYDESEIVIRVLSFGKFVKVAEPQSFVEQIKDRLKRQVSLSRTAD